jgi:hypothetical protein
MSSALSGEPNPKRTVLESLDSLTAAVVASINRRIPADIRTPFTFDGLLLLD